MTRSRARERRAGGWRAGVRRPRAATGGSLLVCVAALAVFAPSAARAAVFMTRDQALAAVFPQAAITRRALVIEDREAAAVQKRARARLTSRVGGAYVATRGDTLLGVAFFDTRTIRTMPGVFMIVIAPDSTVARVEVLAFHEPQDYLPPARWLGQFETRPLTDRMWPKRDIRNLSGASLTSRAITESVRLSLAVYEIVVVPMLAAENRK